MRTRLAIPKTHQSWLRPIFYMCLGMAIWAIIENIPRLFSQHYTTFEIVWMRYTVHLIFMIVFLGPRYKTRLVRTRRLPAQFVRGMLMMGMHLSFIFAIRYLTFHEAMAGFWIAPLILIGVSALRGERADWTYWVVTLIALGGVLLILRPIDGLLHPASLLSIVMALCFVLYLQMTRAMPDEDLLASLFYTAFSVWLVLSAMLPFYWVTPTFQDFLWLAAIGLLGYIGILGFDKAAESFPTWVAAPFAFTQPLFVLTIDWLIRGQVPGRGSLAGAALVTACLGFFSLRMFRSAQLTA